MPEPKDDQASDSKLNYLLDRIAIKDCVLRYARGVDRHDIRIILSAFHPDAIDEHGAVRNDMTSFAQWANQLHDSDFGIHSHNITNHTCSINGDHAQAESYVLYGLTRKNENQVWLGSGRYLDRLERRDGEWKIFYRKTVIDWMFTADASPMSTDYFKQQKYPLGKQSRDDLSYEFELLR